MQTRRSYPLTNTWENNHIILPHNSVQFILWSSGFVYNLRVEDNAFPPCLSAAQGINTKQRGTDWVFHVTMPFRHWGIFNITKKKKKKVFTLISGHFFFESDEYEIEKESTVIKGFGRNISLSNFSYT